MRKTERHNKKRNRFSIVFPILSIIGIGIIAVLSSGYEKSWSYNWNGISDQVRDSIKIAEYGGISSGWVGIAPKKPKQYDRRFWIMKNASESELLKLTEYPNGTIKTIAYEGLIRKKDFDKKSELILKALDDNEFTIEYASGCTGMPMRISEYLVDYVLFINDKSPPLLDGLYNKYNLSKTEIEKIMVEYRKKPKLWN